MARMKKIICLGRVWWLYYIQIHSKPQRELKHSAQTERKNCVKHDLSPVQTSVLWVLGELAHSDPQADASQISIIKPLEAFCFSLISIRLKQTFSPLCHSQSRQTQIALNFWKELAKPKSSLKSFNQCLLLSFLHHFSQ